MEAKLIVEEGPSKGIAFLLDKDSQYYIGRDPDFCTFIVEDPKASRKHALIIKEGKSVSIENLSKTNPLLLNDLLIESKTLLQEGDKIKIGSNVIIFTFDEFKEESNYKEDVFTDFDRDERDKNPSATIYEEILDDKESEFNEAIVDLKIRERFLLKIISGPQVGAEFSITPSKKFIIGSDPLLADIILYDLSVSKKHASITIQEDTTCLIEDLQSRNGIFINGSKIENQARVKPQDVILLGTTSFVLIDTEEESRTIIATGPSIIKEDIDIKEKTAEIKELEDGIEEVHPKEQIISEKPLLPSITDMLKQNKSKILACLIVASIVFLLVLAVSSLYEVKDEVIPHKDVQNELNSILSPFNDINYTYNKNTGTLFLVGHMLTPVEKSQLQYNLKGLSYITKLDDTNVVVDQLIWQEMNNLISRNPKFTGVSMHASKPGVFVINGYLKTRSEFASLQDFLNLNFPYLDRLQNKVAVEEDLIAKFSYELLSHQINAVEIQMNNGEVILNGFIASDKEALLQELIKSWKIIPGIRSVKNFTVILTPQEAVVNLSDKYQVTGFSSKDHTNINVVINGRILTKGDALDGMIITNIDSNVLYLEKDGLKFKIEYNP